jgi:hypothetical protein
MKAHPKIVWTTLFFLNSIKYTARIIEKEQEKQVKRGTE